MRILWFLSISLILFSCVPSSRLYQPGNDAEGELFKKSRKDVLPNDIRNHPDEFTGQLVHWVGIIDSSWVHSQNDTSTIWILGDQKYWDYIEDFSIQTEHFFLSPIGEGHFLSTKSYPGLTADSLTALYATVADKGNLGMFYGIVKGVSDNVPVLGQTRIRFIPGKYFTTKIFQYDVARDSLA